MKTDDPATVGELLKLRDELHFLRGYVDGMAIQVRENVAQIEALRLGRPHYNVGLTLTENELKEIQLSCPVPSGIGIQPGGQLFIKMHTHEQADAWRKLFGVA